MPERLQREVRHMAKKELEVRVKELEDRVDKLERLVNTLQFDSERVPPDVFAERKGLS